VTARYATQAHDIEAEDTITAILKFRSGALGSVVCSTAILPGFAQRLELSGTRGSVIIENSRIVFRHLTAGHDRAAPGPATIRRGSEISTHLDRPGEQSVTAPGNGLSPHAAQIADLLAAIEAVSGGRQQQPSVTAAAGRATLEVICAIYQSAGEGRTIAIPGPRPSH
jgi:UDP-N-acetyl-2-amino-2-deoxyglucuronate dehydrogenase